MIHNEDSKFVAIGVYVALYHKGAFYLFGGWTGSASVHLEYTKKIARLNTTSDSWSIVGCPPEFYENDTLSKLGQLS